MKKEVHFCFNSDREQKIIDEAFEFGFDYPDKGDAVDIADTCRVTSVEARKLAEELKFMRRHRVADLKGTITGSDANRNLKIDIRKLDKAICLYEKCRPVKTNIVAELKDTVGWFRDVIKKDKQNSAETDDPIIKATLEGKFQTLELVIKNLERVASRKPRLLTERTSK